jgi:superfamily II DNA or RNA helicase
MLYDHQKKAIHESNKYPKCLINMWCGTGKTPTFTIDIFNHNEPTNAIVFPSLGLIQQYCKDYILSMKEPYITEFKKYDCLAFCSDNDGKLKSKGITFTTNEKTLQKFMKKNNKIIMVTYQSFEKFIHVCINTQTIIHNIIFDEAHHIVGDKIQNIVFNNPELDAIVVNTRFYTATPVNKNGITMYDSENSDCGVLAYEYLYYQAVEDGICKSFETQITLYTQKSEYKNKYQPIFECIIYACLSGKYNYWNVLTYHSYVEENKNENVSFVNDFAKHEKLLKVLFTKIQNKDFPHTKSIYKVENVILKGVSSKTPNRDEIIENFNKKVEGRIYILASCGILNEGIDTKWANMGVPINPTKSIVKESQRIGRLVRIPRTEQNMHPAIILIPCQVDIAKYSSMDTPEQRDQMIREELSECGNFNTALNVISAFKYQYDPEIFELCLRYPNMYSPKEVKDNLKQQGLCVEESQGTLVDNLKYLCDIDVSGESDASILKEVAKQCEKTIEIHTQDNPIKYINEEATDDEPLRLFYCEDDDTYSPIIPTDKKIPRKTTQAPKKRPKLFNVHTHPDLDKLWKIKDSSIDLNKTFSQGILEVDINYNDKAWDKNYTLLVEYNDTPTFSYVTEYGVKLGNWCGTQKKNKKKGKLSGERIKLLEKIPNWYWEQDLDEQWNKNYKLLVELNDTPINSYVTECGVKLGSWFNEQRQNKMNGKLSQERIKLLEKIPNWFWKIDYQIKWYDHYTLLKSNNDTPIISYVTECGVKLGSWCHTQRENKKNGRLSIEQIELLEKIPNWFWKIDYQKKWYEKYKLLEEYNDTPINSYVTECGFKLGSWCDTQRQNKKNGKLSQQQIELLEQIPNWQWTKNDEEKWYEYYILLKSYNDTPITSYVTECGVKLGSWCQKQRKMYKEQQLNKEQIELLEQIPNWFWEQDFDQMWKEYYKLLRKYSDTPICDYITEDGVKLGLWCQRQRSDKKKNKLYQHQIELLEKIPNWFWDKSDEQWNKTYKLLVELNKVAVRSYITECGVKLGCWCKTQRSNKDKLSQQQIELLEKIPNWFWDKKDMSKPEIKPKTKTTGKPPPKSEMSLLHQQYKTMTSQNLNTYFKEHPDRWDAYHAISKENEQSFPAEDIPRNKMIHYLEHLPGKKQKVVADLGCGFAEIHKYFKDNPRFVFHNFDHHSANTLVVSRDIKNTQLEDYSIDIAILSLAMWGSNCKEYISEVYRILDTSGTLLIAEPYKRWNELDENGTLINRLVKLLEENNFTIVKNDERKFMFIECRKT